LVREITNAVEQAANSESYVRIIVTRGSGELGLDPALAVDPQRIVIVTPLHRPGPDAYENGVKAIAVKTQRATEATDAVGAKVGNYLVAVLAMHKARAVSANEALIVDRDGNVIEGATSNLFWVKAGRLSTPAESAGILAGITRSVVIDAARELGLVVYYGCPKLDELGDVEELFITSSIRQMLSVVAVDDEPIGDGRPGSMYRCLFERFQQIVRRSTEA
jgi:branched-chain amino acid aminotransferase